jgi:hypothetical protein
MDLLLTYLFIPTLINVWNIYISKEMPKVK